MSGNNRKDVIDVFTHVPSLILKMVVKGNKNVPKSFVQNKRVL